MYIFSILFSLAYCLYCMIQFNRRLDQGEDFDLHFEIIIDAWLLNKTRYYIRKTKKDTTISTTPQKYLYHHDAINIRCGFQAQQGPILVALGNDIEYGPITE